jgi:flagellar biosynthesis anti-sigma factor FlgM
MRIDQNYGPQAAPSAERSETQNGAAVSGAGTAGTPPGEDQAHLSGAHAQAEALAAQASQLPEVRQERVQALRQVVLKGQYNPEPEQVAGAMFDSMLAWSAV